MLSRQLLVQLFWEIRNTMQLKKTWFNILLHRIYLHSFIHFIPFSALQQFQCWQPFWFCVSSNVKYRVWSLIVSVPTGDFYSDQRQMETHGMASICWAGPLQAIQQIGFARLVLQGLPPSRCCSFGSILIFEPLCWTGHLNTRKLFFDWNHQNSEGICLSWCPGDFEGAWNDIYVIQGGYEHI